MKILHIHASFTSGGIEAMICNLANEMVKTEDVSVCSILKPKDSDVYWKRLSSNIRKLSLNKLKSGFSLSEIFKICALINRERFDVVNLHGFFYYYIVAIFLLHRRVKFFYTVHSDASKENSGWDKRFWKIKKLFFRLGWIKPITISSISKESFTKLYALDSKLIYNGVPKAAITSEDILESYRITTNTKLFIHAGRISHEKNQLTLVKVFKTLINNGYDVVLLIAGNIQNSSIFNDIKDYLCDRIIYLGERNDILQIMSNSDAMCLPSIWEGLPVTLLESLSVGCVPICSAVGGIPDVITNGENGLLSNSYSEKDYLNVMKYYLSLSEEVTNLMKERCRQSFLDFDIENCAKNYLKYYKGL